MLINPPYIVQFSEISNTTKFSNESVFPNILPISGINPFDYIEIEVTDLMQSYRNIKCSPILIPIKIIEVSLKLERYLFILSIIISELSLDMQAFNSIDFSFKVN